MVSRNQFAVESTAGARYAPATVRQATQVVHPNTLLPNTVLQPDDDSDFASGALIFLVPHTAGRLGLLWQVLHVATIVKAAQDKLYETR